MAMTGVQKQGAECTCYPWGVTPAGYDGPRPWCDVHGQPSVAYRWGIEEGLRRLAEAAEVAKIAKAAKAAQVPPSKEDPAVWAAWLQHAEDLDTTLERFTDWLRPHSLAHNDTVRLVQGFLIADQRECLYGPTTGHLPDACPTSIGDGRCHCSDQRHTP